MNRLAPPAAALVIVLALAACADPSPADPGAGSGNDDDGGATDHPTGAGDAILVIETVGGFAPVDLLATQVPPFALYGDGRVVVQGMQTLEYPGPALPPLVERHLTEAGIQAVLEAVGSTNLFDTDLDLRGAMNVVADAGDTIFRLSAGGREVTVTVYGLGTLLPDMPAPPGMPVGEMEAHQALTALNDQLTLLDTWLSADAWASDRWLPYEPAALRLYVRDATGQSADDGLPEHVVDWPTDDDPATVGTEQPHFGDGTRCAVVEGDAASAWLEALGGARQNTRWTDGGDRRFTVAVRPLLPHEEPACPEPAGA